MRAICTKLPGEEARIPIPAVSAGATAMAAAALAQMRMRHPVSSGYMSRRRREKRLSRTAVLVSSI
jgi:hypothetical protein